MNHPNALQICSNEAQKIAKCFKAKDFTSLMGNMTLEGQLSMHIY